MDSLSRRDFLKLSVVGLLGLFWPALAVDDFPSDLYGRVTTRTLWSYEQPSFSARRARLYWRDLVLPITGVTVSEEEVNAYNRVWYQVGEGEFAYSGNLQPVRMWLNPPRLDLPPRGLLTEVSVPFTDARRQPAEDAEVIYRLYYESVHWALKAVQGEDGRIWYLLLDDKWNQYYYAPAEHLRLLSDDELAPLSSEVPASRKRIEVRLGEQLVLAWEDGRLVFATRASTGKRLRADKYTTPTGHFMTYHKRPTRHMATGDLASSGFDLPGVPWVMYLTESGISFHGTYWHNDFGQPHSHGCINLSPQAAKWLYRWTLPVVPAGEQLAYEARGTQVEILL
ncbi:MAG: L,D-transpeptidase [Anaerolineae bacterium]